MADYKSTHTGAEIDAGIDKAVTADSNWSLLMANLGIGRWANQILYTYYSGLNISDNMADKYTNLHRYISNTSFYDGLSNNPMSRTSQIICDLGNADTKRGGICFATGCNINNLLIKNGRLSNAYGAFKHFKGYELHFENFYLSENTFWFIENCSNLEVVDGLNLSKASNNSNNWNSCPKLKTLKLKGMKYSMNISGTAISNEEDLQNVIDGLVANTGQSLTISSTQNSAMTDTQRTYLTDTLGWSISVA